MRDSVVISIQGDSKIVVPNDLSVVTTFVLREQEDWFEDEIHFVRKLAYPGMKSIDIGASYGLYTVALAKGSGIHGRVISFEPTPETAICLTRTLELNGLDTVDLRRMGVSGVSGPRTLCSGSSSEHNFLGQNFIEGDSGIAVFATSLDDIRDSIPGGIDFLKIDAEGEEKNIIKGAETFLCEESPLVMFELNDEKRGDCDIVILLKTYEYDSYYLLPGLNILVPLPKEGILPAYLMNIFSCKADRGAWLQERGLLLKNDTDGVACNIPAGVWLKKCRDVALSHPYTERWVEYAAACSHRTAKYLLALDLLLAAENDANQAPLRFASLKKARMILSMLCEVEPTVPRLTALVRSLIHSGDKLVACEVIQKTLELIMHFGFEPGDEPFLHPSPQFEWQKGGGSPSSVLATELFSQMQRLYSYSTLFCASFYLDIVADFAGKFPLNPELERRRQLALMFMGLQDHPEPSEYLQCAAPDNLNSAYWIGCSPS